MSALSRILRQGEDGRLFFRCPGCNERHQVRTGVGLGPRWEYNGNPEAPTFTPSILVTWNEPSDKAEEFDDPAKDIHHRCHSYVTDGRIQFLGDTTHALAGQTVEIPDLEPEPAP